MEADTRITELRGEPSVSTIREEAERLGIAETSQKLGVLPTRLNHLLNVYGIQLSGYTSRQKRRQYASVLTRLGAILIDTLLDLPFYIPVLFMEEDSQDLTLLLGTIYLLFMIAFIFWNTIIRMGKTEQSLVRKSLDIAVLDASGKPIGVGRLFLREIIGRWLSGVVFRSGTLMHSGIPTNKCGTTKFRSAMSITWRMNRRMSSPENLSSQGQFQVRALDNVYQTIVQSVQCNTGQTRFYRKNENEETQ